MEMMINRIVRLGNWKLCLTVIDALSPSAVNAKNIKYEITALTYPAQTLRLPPRVSSSDVQHKKPDFSPSSLESVFAGQDLVVSTRSGGDSELQMRIVDAVLAAGVTRYMPHDFEHDTMNKQIQARISRCAGRTEIVEHPREYSMTRSGSEWVAVATGYTLDTNLIAGNLGFDMEWHSVTIHGIGTEPFAASSLQRVEQLVTRAIDHWQKVKNQYIYAAGLVISANEVLRSAEKVTGRE